MSFTTAFKALTLTLVVASFGCIVYDGPPRRRVVVYQETPAPQPAPTYEEWPAPDGGQTTTVVESEPPPSRVEIITESPGVDYVWVGGFWCWRGGWVWTPGCWRYRPGYYWRPGIWVSVGGRSRWRGGVWVRHR